MAYLELEKILKRFGPHEVLQDISLSIGGDEFCVILGPSGCGKSTLLNIVAGLEAPTSGRVIIGGKDVTELPPHKRDMAMVFQNYALYPHLTVFENMAFGLRVRKMEDAVIQNKVREVSRILDIEHKLASYPRQLSGGQRQRVATGRAIVRDPKLFLFDEPLSNLDARLRLEVRKEFLKLQKRLQKASLYVTHDQTEALALGDVVVVIKEGVVQQISAPEDLYRNPHNRFVAEFIGSPPMNMIAGRLWRDGERFVLDHNGMQIPLSVEGRQDLCREEGNAVVLGVRPSAVQLSGDGCSGPVTLVESLGEEYLVYVQLAEDLEVRLLCRERPDVRSGAPVHVRFDPDRLFFFKEDGTRIGRRDTV